MPCFFSFQKWMKSLITCHKLPALFWPACLDLRILRADWARFISSLNYTVQVRSLTLLFKRVSLTLSGANKVADIRSHTCDWQLNHYIKIFFLLFEQLFQLQKNCSTFKKYSKKIIQVWACFEFVARNTVVQLDFNWNNSSPRSWAELCP